VLDAVVMVQPPQVTLADLEQKEGEINE